MGDRSLAKRVMADPDAGASSPVSCQDFSRLYYFSSPTAAYRSVHLNASFVDDILRSAVEPVLKTLP